jgi:hypothetical protein
MCKGKGILYTKADKSEYFECPWCIEGRTKIAKAEGIITTYNYYDNLLETSKLFVDLFEADFVRNGEIVDSPAQAWIPLLVLYRKFKTAIAKAEGMLCGPS